MASKIIKRIFLGHVPDAKGRINLTTQIVRSIPIPLGNLSGFEVTMFANGDILLKPVGKEVL